MVVIKIPGVVRGVFPKQDVAIGFISLPYAIIVAAIGSLERVEIIIPLMGIDVCSEICF